ncbi:hypothetical protein D3C81_1000050 [compost metagenome]
MREPAQKIFIYLLKAHVAQRQTPNVTEIDVRRQTRQAPHLLAIDVQDEVVITKAGSLAPPGATDPVGHPFAPEPIHEAHALSPPRVKRPAQAFQLVLKATEVVPETDLAVHQVAYVSVQLRIGQGRENVMYAAPDRLAAALATATEHIADSAVGNASRRPIALSDRLKAHQLRRLLPINAGLSRKPFAQLSGRHPITPQRHFLAFLESQEQARHITLGRR